MRSIQESMDEALLAVRLDRHTEPVVLRQHNPEGVFPPYANYAHAVEVPAGSRLLFISGLNGYELDGATMPTDFEGQAALIWNHLETTLRTGATPSATRSALPWRVSPMLEPGWLVEVEAVAAA